MITRRRSKTFYPELSRRFPVIRTPESFPAIELPLENRRRVSKWIAITSLTLAAAITLFFLIGCSHPMPSDRALSILDKRAGEPLSRAHYLVVPTAPVDRYPGESKALALIWNQALGETGMPPVIEWREDKCSVTPTGGNFVVSSSGACYLGLYYGGRVIVAWRGAFSSTGLVHELIHAWLEKTTGDGDGEHKRPEWSLVLTINNMLEADGL